MTNREPHALAGQGMLVEAHRIIDAGRSQGICLRLVGGLAVRDHCREPGFCERPYRDIDLAAPRRAAKGATALLGRLGWTENRQVAMAAAGAKRQFFRECRHPTTAGTAHLDDRIDLYLDAFRLHHTIDLRRRFELEPYTVSTSDVALVKLQRTVLDHDDLRDIVTVVKDAAALATDDAPGTLNVGYIAALCAADWGLYHDVSRNVARCRCALAVLGTGTASAAVAARLDALAEALSSAPKTRRWRLRATLGERLAWHEPVDDTEGVYLSRAEQP
jgi:hypothetical protein